MDDILLFEARNNHKMILDDMISKCNEKIVGGSVYGEIKYDRNSKLIIHKKAQITQNINHLFNDIQSKQREIKKVDYKINKMEVLSKNAREDIDKLMKYEDDEPMREMIFERIEKMGKIEINNQNERDNYIMMDDELSCGFELACYIMYSEKINEKYKELIYEPFPKELLNLILEYANVSKYEILMKITVRVSFTNEKKIWIIFEQIRTTILLNYSADSMWENLYSNVIYLRKDKTKPIFNDNSRTFGKIIKKKETSDGYVKNYVYNHIFEEINSVSSVLQKLLKGKLDLSFYYEGNNIGEVIRIKYKTVNEINRSKSRHPIIKYENIDGCHHIEKTIEEEVERDLLDRYESVLDKNNENEMKEIITNQIKYTGDYRMVFETCIKNTLSIVYLDDNEIEMVIGEIETVEKNKDILREIMQNLLLV